MPKSGMRYAKMKALVKDMEGYKQQMVDVMTTLENERAAAVERVYGGTAADSFKNNMKNIAADLETKINNIIKQLNTEAETQHDNYLKQEAALDSGPVALTQ